MGDQKKMATEIISRKADYILAIKDNQPTLCPDALLMSQHSYPDDKHMEAIPGTGVWKKEETEPVEIQLISASFG